MRLLPLLRVALLFAVASTLHAQTYTDLYNFGSKSGDPTYPSYSGVIALSRGGNLFSTVGNGAPGNTGKAFRITPSGSLAIVHSFKWVDGQEPAAGLTLATDGQYYGTTRRGGAYGFGTVFKMTQSGVITTLYSFQGGTDGAFPMAPPIQSQSGEFYGTTVGQSGYYGAPGHFYGSVYRITRYGEFTLLHAFTDPDGWNPFAPLVQGTDFFFYGTAVNGGPWGARHHLPSQSQR